MHVCLWDGEIFLAGYQHRKQNKLHRFGYLSDSQYRFAQKYIEYLRESGDLDLPSQVDLLKGRLSILVPDPETRVELLVDAKAGQPHMTEEDVYQAVITLITQPK